MSTENKTETTEFTPVQYVTEVEHRVEYMVRTTTSYRYPQDRQPKHDLQAAIANAPEDTTQVTLFLKAVTYEVNEDGIRRKYAEGPHYGIQRYNMSGEPV